MQNQPNSAETVQSADTVLTRANRTRITDRLVKSLEPPEKRYRIVYDEQVRGFGVQLLKSGVKSFILEYRFKGVQKRMTIGRYPEWSVLAARQEAEVLRTMIGKGVDPKQMRDEEYSAPTVKDMYKRHIEQEGAKLSPGYLRDVKRTYRDYILPKLGNRKVADLTFSDCEALHRKISTADKPVRANRVHAILRRGLSLSKRWGWITNNPAEGVQHNREEGRTRYLSSAELKRLFAALDEHPYQTSCDAVRMMIYTGCRCGEALNARWDQFDEEFRVWSKPSAATKQRKPHVVPVSKEVTKLLKRRSKKVKSAFIFPSDETGVAMTNIKRTWETVRTQAGIPDVRLHDLRHTFASIVVSNGESLPIVGALLGHTQAQTTARYAHLQHDRLRQTIDGLSIKLSYSGS